MITARFEPHTLLFHKPGGTSRGILTEKKLWLIYLSDGKTEGVGECSVIPGLTPEYSSDAQYEKRIAEICANPQLFSDNPDLLLNEPSIRFGWETALRNMETGGKTVLFDNGFSRGEQAIPINGLIWMGTPEFMQEQIDQKLNDGYSCIKMKVGAIDFETELDLLKKIRNRYGASEIILRVDANGAFSPAEARKNLPGLAKLQVHSIEQPIKAGNLKEMQALCREEIIPVALDEELIGINDSREKALLLEEIAPQFLILKPGLHGGISGTQEWISLAEKQHTDWWMTSALESNVGLNAIAQLTGNYNNPLHQGLGTGALYTTNFPTQLFIEKGELHFRT